MCMHRLFGKTFFTAQCHFQGCLFLEYSHRHAGCLGHSQPLTQDLDGPPALLTTSWQTFRKPLAQFAATRCALCVCSSRSTRFLNPAWSTAAFFTFRSRRSILFNSRRSQLQNFSTGLRSGEPAGIFQRFTLSFLWILAAAGARRIPSLSLRTRLTQKPAWQLALQKSACCSIKMGSKEYVDM